MSSTLVQIFMKAMVRDSGSRPTCASAVLFDVGIWAMRSRNTFEGKHRRGMLIQEGRRERSKFFLEETQASRRK